MKVLLNEIFDEVSKLAFSTKKCSYKDGCNPQIINQIKNVGCAVGSDKCAGFVTLAYDYISGGNADEHGIGGLDNYAWKISENIVTKGGKRIWWIENLLKNDEKIKLNSLKGKIYTKGDNTWLASEITPLLAKDYSRELPELKIGDVISLFNPDSSYHWQAFYLSEYNGRELMGGLGGQINTHIGIVTCINENGPIISHKEGSQVKVVPWNSILPVYYVYAVTRPSEYC